MIGRRLSGRYKVIDTIGGGGMANVYLARDMILERNVAVKVLRPDFSNDEEFIRRFHREAQAATSLNHPNIVSIYDVGEEDNIFYIVMEHIDGTTLKEYIQKNGPLSNEESVNIMIQLTSALANAHENQIVHRDIKPQNILIDEHGIVKVTDFGIAVALSSTTITQTNSFLGSVHYLSPEQARGGMATKKSDIYSLGIVMFELLTGRMPFFGESAVSIALKHLQNDTPSPKRWNSAIPQSIENIVLKATAKDPFHRYDTVEAMEDDLRTSLEPRRLNEPPFKAPVLDGDVTKAIPIITKEHLAENSSMEDTIVHKEPKKVKTNPKNRGKKIAIWVISIFFLLSAAAVASITIIPSLLLPKDVVVPDVTTLSYEAAYKELDSIGLIVGESVKVFDEEVLDGQIVRTLPNAGQTVKEGAEITLYISKGKEKEEIENYIGQNIDEIMTSIKATFKNVDIRPEPSETIPAGEITGQIPESGEFVLEEETLILFVSEGPQAFQLQNLVSLNQVQVDNYVAEKGLNLVEVTEAFSEEFAEGIVISQKPKAGTEVKRGHNISIVVSKGPEQKNKTVNRTVLVKYEPLEGEEGQPQEVQIYVDDLDRDISSPAITDTITADKEYKLVLNIPYKKSVTYKIQRNGDVIDEVVVSYDDEE
ncbi:serine/threonine-protein kinase [Bacillus mesophilus]|uniref:Serine/threonine-protein kinase PrkC n=1 Tax=Bacillus mesophilus TaxID=1808955 RepID=A0A6M0Q286_9BACI|nr:Stk1 family PASTA domain-containing Ser/Thr kinase [Bacillus mesophilus]MBM7659409.1 serine/threonine-protein kinase [Bacillus mesophilus]NEY70282.1 Stk1 family PASTA domain-containing Ser/Thr kinase [Bacillus mesophilus]